MFTVALEIILSPNEVLAEEKQNVTIACGATGQPQPGITWSKAFGNLPMNILGLAAGTFHLVVFSRLRFKARPPKEMTPMAGSTVHLPCAVEGDLKTTISWTKHGKSSLLKCHGIT